MGVPNTFANAAATIPLAQLDQNFSTTLTIGNTSVGLGNSSPTFTPNSVAGIIGTTTNDSVNAGGVGEYTQANVVVGSAVSLSTGVGTNICNIACTAGDYEVNGVVTFTGGLSTAVTVLIGGASSVSASLGNRGLTSRTDVGYPSSYTPFGGNDISLPFGPTRFSLAGNTTVYLVADAVFTVSTLSAYGQIRARRVR